MRGASGALVGAEPAICAARRAIVGPGDGAHGGCNGRIVTPSPLTVAALLFGFSSSLHCAAMCGPLVSVVVPGRPSAVLAYAAARVGAYATGGLVAGALGELLSGHVPRYLAPAVGLVGALFLLGQAAGISFPLPRGEAWQRGIARGLATLGNGAPAARGALLGAATAVLPCGLLASVYALSAAAGTASAGAATAATFAIGSTAGLLALPAALRLLVSPRIGQGVQRAGLFLAGGLLAVRAFEQARTGSCCP